MNITSKFKQAFGGCALLFLAACQGPWSYWPDDTAPYLGVYTYAHIVSGRPVSDVCFAKMLKLTEAKEDAFAFFDSATVRITGPFSGLDTVLALTQNSGKPNCFDGPADLLAEVGGDYSLDATVYWDSSGTRVSSHFTSQTYIPKTFRIVTALAPAPALLTDAYSDPRVLNALHDAYGDTLYSLMADSAAALAFYQANAEGISKVLRSILTPYNEMDSLYYMDPPNDLLSHYYVPEYSSDVGGVLITEVFDTSTVAFGSTTFDTFFGQQADTLDKAVVGDRHRLSFLRNEEVSSAGNALDSMAVSNVWLTIGRTDLLFYATTPEYADYIYTSIISADDSRIKAEYNIVGGAGIFTGMLVDTFSVFTQSLPGGKAYPYMRARTLYCKDQGWIGKECRAHMATFCAENGYVDHECWPISVRAALDSGLAWNAFLADTVPVDSQSVVRYGGEKKWCMAHNFPDTLSTGTCQLEYKLAQESDTPNQSMVDLWSWCYDRNWPIANAPQCGTALVSWTRLNDPESFVLVRETNKWCNANANDPQCKLRK